MVNSSSMHRTEICRSRIMICSTCQIRSLVSAVGGRPLRGVSSKARAEFMNLTTHFAAVRYDNVELP